MGVVCSLVLNHLIEDSLEVGPHRLFVIHGLSFKLDVLQLDFEILRFALSILELARKFLPLDLHSAVSVSCQTA